jgi:GNAT superfamily N-acetyltransferase
MARLRCAIVSLPPRRETLQRLLPRIVTTPAGAISQAMEIIEITAPEDGAYPELRARAVTSTKARHTHHYIIRDGDEEIAFLSLDLIPSVNYLVLYEVFVPQELRRRGIGSKVLREVEELAKRRGYEKITLTACPLDDDFSEDELVGWYKKRGYTESPDCPDKLEKWLSS